MTTLISIFDPALREINYTDKRTNQPAKLLTQTAYLHTLGADGKPASPIPDKFEIVLPKGQTVALPPGDYTLHPSALYVDRQGRLTVSPRLVPAARKA